MADRPRSDGSGDGTPEYGWLYGKKKPGTGGPDPTRPVPQQPRPPREPRPDETRVMRVQPRDQPRDQPRPAGSGGAPPQAPRPAPAPVPPSRGGGRGVRVPRPRFRARYLLIVLLAWVVFLVAVPFYAWTKVDKIDWEPDGDRPADQPGTTYLLVGSDTRGDLSAEERKELGTGDVAGARTDTIMLLHTGSGPNLLMSIPRDSNVEIPGHGVGKINGAYAFGQAKLLTRTIEDATGIRIDDYVEIGMGGLAGVVDAVGGIEICPKTAMKDPQAKLNIKRGCQEVDGATALGYARSRKTYTRFGDVQRAQAQREVVAAVGKKVLSPWTFVNPVRYWRLNNAVPDFFGFGEGTSPVRAAMWAMAMTRVNGDAGLTCGVPISDLTVNWDDERAEQMFEAIREDKVDEMPKGLCSPTGLPKEITG
ncbi:LCP family protein [Nocardioides dongkuii]|uniref:LCP family protein n=1 Tax=Nocardioides dongkuii TaxID=2760089 RepID=UPI0015FE7270|nr:LCP family protein [Nocardioides dongkuii]